MRMMMSAKQRKFLEGNGSKIYDIPCADVLYHNPSKSRTIYLAREVEALYFFGSQSCWCVASRNAKSLQARMRKLDIPIAQEYLDTGNMILLHDGPARYIIYRKERYDHWSLGDYIHFACYDWQNNPIGAQKTKKLLGIKLYNQLIKLPYHKVIPSSLIEGYRKIYEKL